MLLCTTDYDSKIEQEYITIAKQNKVIVSIFLYRNNPVP